MILLTGANGHLGANLLRRLLAEGASVRVLLRPQSDNSTLDDLKVERVLGDLRDSDSLVAASKDCAEIYHCAAQVSTVSRGEQDIFDCNVLGTRNLLRAALQNGVRLGDELFPCVAFVVARIGDEEAVTWSVLVGSDVEFAVVDFAGVKKFLARRNPRGRSAA